MIDNRLGLYATPWMREVASGAGLTSIVVANASATTINWSAAVQPGAAWLGIVHGGSGVNGGIIFLAFSANPDPGPRTGVVRVSAPGAAPPFVDVSVVQAGTDPGPAVTHFEFDLIPGPYQVGEPIPVTIRAMDGSKAGRAAQATGFTGWVDVASSTPVVQLSRSRVFMQDGEWSGALSADQAFAGLRLSAAQGQVQGISSLFDITSLLPPAGCISGAVLEPSGFRVAGATVTVTSSAGAMVSDTTPFTCGRPAILGGEYCFCDLAPGEYTLSARKGVWRASPIEISLGEKRGISRDVWFEDSSKPPVLLVGGILGSTQRPWVWANLAAPKLRGLPCSPSPDDLILLDPSGVFGFDIWRSLRVRLSEDFNPVDVPWDWRARIDDATITKYLVNKIESAKKREGAPDWPKVNVVAHSLGGLLVRAYIESDLYSQRNDIDRLALCATPHEGTPLIYYIWEGADAKRADSARGGKLYARTLDNLYSAVHGGNVYNGDQLTIPQIQLWQFIRTYIPGSSDVMPTRGLVRSGMPVTPADVFTPNLLDTLRTSSQRFRLTGANGDPSLVRTKLFLGTLKPTIYEQAIGPPRLHTGIYQDGDPIGDPVKLPLGDETVYLYDRSAVGLGHISSASPLREAEHTQVMAVYREEICAFLNDGQPCGSYRGDDVLAGGTEQPAAALALAIEGRVQPSLTDPMGLASGIDSASGETVQEMTRTTMEVMAEGAGYLIEDPMAGTYRLDLTALPGEVFTLDVNYLDAAGVEQASARGIYHDGVVSIDIEVSAAPAVPTGREGSTRRGKSNPRDDGQPRIAIRGALAPPANIRAERVNNLARIAWDVSPDAATAEYRLYARPEDQPKFTLLGTATATPFDTAHPWMVAGQGTRWQYFVTAAAADGRESLFDTVVENHTPLIARLQVKGGTGPAPLTVQFYDVSAGEVTAWAWDFDGDGLPDSTAQHPTYTFAAPGVYTVALTVGGPEGTDTAIEVGVVEAR